jgi:folylpolyglutamate synthase/dihydropteroate synthase
MRTCLYWQAITWQKTGIIKRGCGAVLASQQAPDILADIAQAASAEGISTVQFTHTDQHTASKTSTAAAAVAAAVDGAAQALQWVVPDNLELARCAAVQLGLPVDLNRAVWPARFEVFDVPRNITADSNTATGGGTAAAAAAAADGLITHVVIDGAHNRDSICKLLHRVVQRSVQCKTSNYMHVMALSRQ